MRVLPGVAALTPAWSSWGGVIVLRTTPCDSPSTAVRPRLSVTVRACLVAKSLGSSGQFC
jgi:hypothetical protein